MATTHVFIVSKETFPIHLQYMFAGTGSQKENISINLNQLLSNKPKNSVGMIADLSRIRLGDKILFYIVQDLSKEQAGKFYGIFKAKSELIFDNNLTASQQSFTEILTKVLPYRVLIEADEVYENGIEEWHALDDFSQIPIAENIQTNIPLMQ